MADDKTNDSKEDEKYELIDTEGIFSDMYNKDEDIQNRIQEVLQSKELKVLMKRSDAMVELYELLLSLPNDEALTLQKLKLIKKGTKEVPPEPAKIEKLKKAIEKRQLKLISKLEDLCRSTEKYDDFIPEDRELLPLHGRLKNMFGGQTSGDDGEKEQVDADVKRQLGEIPPIELNRRKLRLILRKSANKVKFLNLLHEVVKSDPNKELNELLKRLPNDEAVTLRKLKDMDNGTSSEGKRPKKVLDYRKQLKSRQDRLIKKAKKLCKPTGLYYELIPREKELLSSSINLDPYLKMSKGRSGDKAGDSKPDAKQRLKDMDPIERNWRILTLLIEKAKKNYKNLNLPQDNLSRFSLKIFREDPEYGSKIAYMLYLKRAYRFFMIPLEERPGLLSRIFYADASSKWKPSHEEAKDLLEKFYLETKLIKKLPDRNWYKIKKSKDPEVVLNNILYGIEFKPDFEGFLRNIPWIVSKDRYGAPALDLVLWNPPGTEVPQKPVGVDDEFIDKLVAGVREHESYARIEVDDEFVELKNRKQIEKRLEEDERVLIDSYVGVSKIERDFVLHKRLILWRNPGFERWEEESKMGKIRSSKPEPYLALLQEKATQLEIPFIAHEKTTKKK